jgi:hypothetical protein
MNCLKYVSYVIFVFLALACGSEETPKTKTELLSGNIWVVEKAQFIADGALLNVFERGASNNLFDASKFEFIIKKDNTATIVDANGATTNGTWKLTADETVVSLSAGLPFTEMTLISVTEKQLDLEVPNFTVDALGQKFKGDLMLKLTPKK